MEFTEHDPIEEVLPKTGWLAEYTKITSDLEACARFRFFSAACVLGAVINNRVFIHRGDPDLLPKLFPNLWVLLLAPPGRGHKTSTINMAVNCMQQAVPDIRLVANKLTPESLIKALAEPQGKEIIRIGPRDATGLITAPEFSVFFGKQQYNTGLVQLIADLYDYRETWISDTIMRGRHTLKRICISILGASTPKWLQRLLPEDAFSGGFMSRYILVEMPVGYLKHRPRPKRMGKTTWQDLVAGLSIFRSIEGEMVWTPAGEKYWDDLYHRHKPTGNEQLDAYMDRHTEQILRIAMLLAITEHKLIVDGSHMHHAEQIAKCVMNEAIERIYELSDKARLTVVDRMQEVLKVRGTITKEELFNRVYKSLTRGESEFMDSLNILIRAKRVSIGGKPANLTITYIREREEE